MRARKRAFTLTEIVIVLGIIGAILGAIWSAASHVGDSQKVNRAVTQILVISEGIRALYPSGTISGGSQDLTALLQNSRIIPSDMISTDCVGTSWGAYGTTCSLNPWGIQAIFGSQQGWYGAQPAPNKYEIAIDPVTSTQCPAFLAALVPQAVNDGLVWVWAAGITPTAVNTTTSPSAFTNCGGGAIVLQFQL